MKRISLIVTNEEHAAIKAAAAAQGESLSGLIMGAVKAVIPTLPHRRRRGDWLKSVQGVVVLLRHGGEVGVYKRCVNRGGSYHVKALNNAELMSAALVNMLDHNGGIEMLAPKEIVERALFKKD